MSGNQTPTNIAAAPSATAAAAPQGNGSEESRPWSANEQALAILERTGNRKGAETLRNSLIAQKAANSNAGADKTAEAESSVPGTSVNGNNAAATTSTTTTAATTKKDVSGSSKPQPIPENPSLPLEELVRRNLPQAFAASTSTASYNLTPEFIAQAESVVRMQLEKVQKTQEAGPSATDPSSFPLLDSTDRIRGYTEFARWLAASLSGWRPELSELLFPVFVHTFLDLIDTASRSAALEFFTVQSPSHITLHSRELATLATINSPAHILMNPLFKRFRTEKYVINLSKSSFGLLVGWLSDIGLEGLWDVSKGTGRYKEAIRQIVNNRIKLQVSESSSPLPMPSTARQNGLIQGLLSSSTSLPSAQSSVEAFNALEPTLKLGKPTVGPGLAKHTEMVLDSLSKDETAAQESAPETAMEDTTTDQPGGVVSNGSGDVEMKGSEMTGVKDTPADGSTEKGQVPSSENKKTTTETLPPHLEPISRSQVIGFGSSGNFSSIDLAKEVKAVTDARKRIKLGDKHMVAANGNVVGGYLRPPTLPSVCCYTIFDGGEGTTSTAISDDASYMAAGSSESVIRLWSLKGQDLPTHEYGYATKIAQGGQSRPDMKREQASPSGSGEAPQEKATTSSSHTVRKLVGHSGPVYSVAFDPIAGSAYPPSHLLSSSQDGSVRLWSLDTWKNLAVYKGHADPVWAVEWGPYGAHFATASRDRTARLWITDRVAPVRMFAGHLSDVDCLKFHPNSLYLATGSSDRTCRLWDVQRGECVRVFMGHEDAVDCLAMSPDGRYLASASQDLTIKLWDSNSGRMIKSMLGHTQPIHSLSFSADSSVIVSGGADCTVRVWDAKTMGGKRSDHASVQEPQTVDLLTTYYTKRTPITTTHFTPRNLCLAAGIFTEAE